MTLRVLYLDFDRVLHPRDVRVSVRRGIFLSTPGHTLFEHVPLVEHIMADFPEVSIVLSTSWVCARSFDFARTKLSAALQARVIGATFHRRHMRRLKFEQLTRYQLIAGDSARRALARDHWVAIDDDDGGWPSDQRDRLVHTDNEGLRKAAVQRELRDKLATLVGQAA